jgi:hypothetical protein
VEEFGAGSQTEGVESLTELPINLLQVHRSTPEARRAWSRDAGHATWTWSLPSLDDLPPHCGRC